MAIRREDIKFYLETIAATLISIMAVLVAFSQCSISREQTRLLKMQTDIAKKQLLPTFVISAAQLKEDIKDSYSEDKIFIENKGFPISEFNCESRVVFKGELTKISVFHKEAFIPINGYYSGTAHTAKGDGLLATIEGYRNNFKAAKFERKFSEYCGEKGEIGNINILRFVRISYKDAFEVEHIEYFDVPLIYGAYRMTSEKGKEVFKEYDEKWEHYGFPEFDQITVEEFYDLIMKS